MAFDIQKKRRVGDLLQQLWIFRIVDGKYRHVFFSQLAQVIVKRKVFAKLNKLIGKLFPKLDRL